MKKRLTLPSVFVISVIAQLVPYIIFLKNIHLVTGASKLAELYWIIYGPAGGILLYPFLSHTEDGMDAFVRYGPLISVFTYSLLITLIAKIIRSRSSRKNA